MELLYIMRLHAHYAISTVLRISYAFDHLITDTIL